MQKLKRSLFIFSLIGASLVAPMSVAETGEAGSATSQASQQSTQPSSQYASDQSVEDLVAIAKAGQQNEAINDAVLGNEAITEAVPRLDRNLESGPNEADGTQSVNQDNVGAATQPRQSTAQSVESDKLILNSPVVDQANVFTPKEKQMLSQRLRHIYDQGLAQAALVTVPSTNGMDIFQYSLEIAERWELGEADTDDGLLILVAVNDRNMYILSGYGLEGVLPDAALNRIIDDEIMPYFRQGDYAGGLVKGINRIEERLVADPDILAQSDELAKERSQGQSADAGAPSLFGTFLIALIFGTFLTAVFGRILGSLFATGGFVVLALSSGAGLIMTIFMAVFLWLFLVSRGSGGGKGGGKGGRGGRRGGGVVFFPGGGFGGGSGGFGGGGFGGGGFGGGGGGFGGGGAGGSW